MPRPGLRARLFAGHALVIAAGSLTLALFAFALAPGVFRAHIRSAVGPVPGDLAQHLDEALANAIVVSLGVAAIASLLTALGVSWFLTRRIVGPVRTLAQAAGHIADGSYGTRVPALGSGDELATLGDAFNEMAAGLEAIEGGRRQLLADLAHELRTPLATIEGYVEGMADGVITPGAQTWDVLQAEIRRLGRLVEDLGKVSRAQEGRLDLRLAALPPGVLAKKAVQAAEQAFAAKGVGLTLRTDDAVPAVVVDPERLHEVLTNLLDNALRHTPPAGHVEVSVARARRDVEIAVADDGQGIAPEDLGHVFERFWRADRARSRGTGGSGIGLTIARALVEAHGGSIRAESAGPGRGARLVVALPPHPT